jgi:ribosome-associated protein
VLRVKPGLSIPLSEIAFSADTSGGKGGQHANRSSTRVELRFDVVGSPSLTSRQRALIAEKLGPRIAADGSLRVVSAQERSQLRNRNAALARLAQLLARGLERPKPRTATKPTLASRKVRVEVKKKRGVIKARRKKPVDDE